MDISTSDFLTPESSLEMFMVEEWRVHGSKFKAQQLKIEKFVVQKFMIEDSMVKVSAIEQSGVEKSGVDPCPLLIYIWFLKNKVGWTGFLACKNQFRNCFTGSKNLVWNRLKIQFVELNFYKLIFQKSSKNQQGVGLKFPGFKCPANLSEIMECHPLKIENLSGFLTQLRSPDPNLASHQWTWPLGFYLHKKVNIGY